MDTAPLTPADTAPALATVTSPAPAPDLHTTVASDSSRTPTLASATAAAALPTSPRNQTSKTYSSTKTLMSYLSNPNPDALNSNRTMLSKYLKMSLKNSRIQTVLATMAIDAPNAPVRQRNDTPQLTVLDSQPTA